MRAVLALATNSIKLLARQWRIATSILMSLGILVVALLNYEWLLRAFEIVYQANLLWLAAAVGTSMISFLITSQVLVVALRSLGHRPGILRMWGTSLVAIVLSQSVPAGGVGGYALLVGIMRRHGVPVGQATLVASLEAVSYVTAMLLIFLFSLFYLTLHGLGTGIASYIAAAVALLLLSSAIFVLTRDKTQLAFIMVRIKNIVATIFRRDWPDTWVLRKVSELTRGRAMIAERYHELLGLIVIQLIALLGHSLAMLMVLWSLGVETSYFVVVSAFGLALITSTFNVLPGGGGTVEAVLVAVLSKFGVGMAAVPTAIIFRLFNFWLMMPVAAGCYHWLMHEKPSVSRKSTKQRSKKQPVTRQLTAETE